MVGNRPPVRVLVVPILQTEINVLSKQSHAVFDIFIRIRSWEQSLNLGLQVLLTGYHNIFEHSFHRLVVLRLLRRWSPRLGSVHSRMKVARLCLPVGELLHYRRRRGNVEDAVQVHTDVLLVAVVEASIVGGLSPGGDAIGLLAAGWDAVGPLAAG